MTEMALLCPRISFRPQLDLVSRAATFPRTAASAGSQEGGGGGTQERGRKGSGEGAEFTVSESNFEK